MRDSYECSECVRRDWLDLAVDVDGKLMHRACATVYRNRARRDAEFDAADWAAAGYEVRRRRYIISIEPTSAERAAVRAALDDAMSLDARYQPGTLRILQELRRLF